jgi:hypothetical protein
MVKGIPPEWLNLRWRPYLEGDTVTLHFRERTYEGIVTRAMGQHVEVDLRPRILGMPVEIDNTLSEGEIRIKVRK